MSYYGSLDPGHHCSEKEALSYIVCSGQHLIRRLIACFVRTLSEPDGKTPGPDRLELHRLIDDPCYGIGESRAPDSVHDHGTDSYLSRIGLSAGFTLYDRSQQISVPRCYRNLGKVSELHLFRLLCELFLFLQLRFQLRDGLLSREKLCFVLKRFLLLLRYCTCIAHQAVLGTVSEILQITCLLLRFLVQLLQLCIFGQERLLLLRRLILQISELFEHLIVVIIHLGDVNGLIQEISHPAGVEKQIIDAVCSRFVDLADTDLDEPVLLVCLFHGILIFLLNRSDVCFLFLYLILQIGHLFGFLIDLLVQIIQTVLDRFLGVLQLVQRILGLSQLLLCILLHLFRFFYLV